MGIAALLVAAFIICLLMPIYTYLLYPLLLVILAKFARTGYKTDLNSTPSISIIVAAYNEAKSIEEKVLNLLELNYPQDKMEILIGSDGSTDDTFRILQKYVPHPFLKIFDFPRSGKVGVVNRLVKESHGEILIFSDANTVFEKDAIREIVKYFVDERIGCVSGQLRLRTGSGKIGAVGESTYWKYENLVKKLESKIGALSGANGAIYGIRRVLCPPTPEGIVNDDFYISMRALAANYEVIMNEHAVAYEYPNESLKSQFRRHIRDGSGHYQVIGAFIGLINPFRGKKAFVYTSHRLIRWLVPFALMLAFIFNGILATNSYFFNVLFILHCIGYLLMVLYYFAQLHGWRNKWFNMPFYFLCVNLALLIGFFKNLMKRQNATWNTER